MLNRFYHVVGFALGFIHAWFGDEHWRPKWSGYVKRDKKYVILGKRIDQKK